MTADRILSVARAELGTKENPAGSNKVKYNTDYYGRAVSGSQYAWCAVFVWWVFRQAGADRLYYSGNKTAYCPALMAHHRGQHVTDYRPGDVIFFNFSGKTSAAHVGICESWDGQYITTIDGNTGTDNEANGGAVMRRKRAKKYIVGAYRPAYEATVKTYPVELPLLQKGSSGGAVKALQLLLTGLGYDTKGADGQFGTNTERALEGFQRARGLTADRKCGPASWSALMGT